MGLACHLAFLTKRAEQVFFWSKNTVLSPFRCIFKMEKVPLDFCSYRITFPSNKNSCKINSKMIFANTTSLGDTMSLWQGSDTGVMHNLTPVKIRVQWCLHCKNNLDFQCLVYRSSFFLSFYFDLLWMRLANITYFWGLSKKEKPVKHFPSSYNCYFLEKCCQLM